jgi:prepilin-type N-terminal cleavage/methylation domain-containing protein
MKRRSLLSSKFTARGFTLLELIVVMVLIGVLFAIAAPNWVAFINQQRVGSARNQVSQAIRTAQSEAKRTKVNRAIVFQNNNNQPRYAIVPAPDNTINLSNANWQTLGDGTIQPGLIRLSVERAPNQNQPPPLIFDSYGAIPPNVTLMPYTITIGSTASTNPRRCVEVHTILGATTEGSNSDCK